MELKILFDQLNGAAEEYFLARPENEFPINPITGNANLGPESVFRGGVRRISENNRQIYTDSSIIPLVNMFKENFTDWERGFSWFKVRQIIADREIFYNLKFPDGQNIPNFAKRREESKDLSNEYNFLIKTKHSKNCPNYLIRICKCKKDCQEFNSVSDGCGGEDCFQFEVSLNNDLSDEEKLKVFRWLWWAFEFAPNPTTYPPSIPVGHLKIIWLFFLGQDDGGYCNGREYVEEILQKWFEPLYRNVFCPEEASGESSTAASQQSSAAPGGSTTAKVDWAGEERLWGGVFYSKFDLW
eukprot:GHVP01003021.1.p1 GENE.GHVP01003021.1~~GHVP01003021.1.p1  ORF type:complete len:298 (-),score=48.35 GHVP01003021.1:20-913(-)